MQAPLTKGVYVLYGLLETKTPQGHFLHSADDKVPAAGMDKSLSPQSVEHLGLELGPT